MRILLTPPGYVREHVGVSDAPEPAADEYYYPAPWAPADAQHVGAGQTGVVAASASPPMPPAADAAAPAAAPVPPEVPEAPEAPALPALVGPLGAAALQPPAPLIAVPAQPPAPAAAGGVPQWNGLIPRPSRMPSAKPVLAPAHRYCHRCMRVRPPRAHHCRRCGTCVLRMDHHCPWIGGCGECR